LNDSNKIIVALDAMSEADSLSLAESLQDVVWGFKVNDLLISSGVKIVEKLKRFGNVFADPKLYDIPNTVGNSVARLSGAGADLITVHSSAGKDALEKANERRGDASILAITVLTSFSNEDSLTIFKQEPEQAVLSLAAFANDCGVQGVVCSPRELNALSSVLPDSFMRVTPGVRPSWYGISDDQSRVATPRAAVDAGASCLVVGRPITKSEDPVFAAKRIAEELA